MKAETPDTNPDRPKPMSWDEYRELIQAELATLLNNSSGEKPMQKFLEQHPSLLPGAGEVGQGGHHGAWWGAVISQPELKGLGPTRFPDFMFVRRDTTTTQPVCIEIEDPNKPWFNKSDLTPSAKLTQALDQLDEWRLWFEKPENQLIFKQMFVPEAYRHRRIEPYFVLVYGRASEFEAHGPHKDYQRARAKRDRFQGPNQRAVTYDMLEPHWHGRMYGTIRGQAGKFEIMTIPPTFQTGTHLLTIGSLMDASTNIRAALECNGLLDRPRAVYLSERWNHWTTRMNLNQTRYLSGGLE